MRKLGKKNHEMIETIEAYCSCSCGACSNCSCSCTNSEIYYTINATASSSSLTGVTLGRTSALSGR
jgi:putative bacteriocin precursor